MALLPTLHYNQVMTLAPSLPIAEFSLSDLRRVCLGNSLERNVDRFASIANKAPLEMANVLADYAHLGQITDNPLARNFRTKLGQLSGVTDDKKITDFRSELVTVPYEDWGSFQVIFLNPLRATGNEKIHSPIILWSLPYKIVALRPSLNHQGEYIKYELPDHIARGETERKLVEFINFTDEDNLTYGYNFVTSDDVAHLASNAVEQEMKRL